jgi:hypothetical protein
MIIFPSVLTVPSQLHRLHTVMSVSPDSGLCKWDVLRQYGVANVKVTEMFLGE